MSMLKSRGFTLIEVMITVAIIGILAAIAYPNYQDQVRKSRRADAKIALGNAAQLQERWFTQKGTYTSDIDNLGGTLSDDKYYKMKVDVTIPAGANCNVGGKFYCYTLTAAPNGGTQVKDTACGSFTLEHTGKQGVTGGTASAEDCW